jgi:hypothetical protein
VALLATLGQAWVLSATLAFGGLVYLGDAATQRRHSRSGAARFLLNVLSLPVGVLALLETVLLWSSLSWVEAAIALVVGAVLVGRSLREVPWTGALSVAAAVATVFLVERYSPWSLSVVEVLIIGGLVFVIVYGLLYLLEIPLRLAGLLAVPRIFLVILAAAAFVGAALLVL